MPDFAIVSLEDAKLQTISGRQRQYMNEYAGYIRQLSHGKAGMLHPGEHEILTTIRRRLTVAAKTSISGLQTSRKYRPDPGAADALNRK